MNFTSFKNARVVRSSWLEEGGRRLDCNPYMSGALEARDTLRRLGVRKDPLSTLTAGYAGGIYNGPMFKRNYVESPEYGVPFISSGAMMLADLSNLPLLRRRDAESSRLSYLRLRQGMTLISCSGTIGRMAYVRSDMDGVWSSQDVLKVVPNASLIPPGYLHAFLSSRYGVPLVVAGTYGAIIQHIEPNHLVNINVPRFEIDIETEIGDHVEQAAYARTKASALLRDGVERFLESVGLPDISASPISTGFSTTTAMRSELVRLDATYFSPFGKSAADAFCREALNPRRLGECARVFTPGIFKRMYVEEPAWGYAYYSGSELFEFSPSARGYLSRRAPNIEEYLIRKDWLLIQDAGQVGGLIGRITRAGCGVDHSVVSNHLIRVATETQEDAAFLFAVLSSSYGYRAIIRNAFGSSIPQLDPKRIAAMMVPWLDDKRRAYVYEPIILAWNMMDVAEGAERKATARIENLIQRGD